MIDNPDFHLETERLIEFISQQMERAKRATDPNDEKVS